MAWGAPALRFPASALPTRAWAIPPASELNLYRYCHNDPINKTDLVGLDAEFTLMRDPYVAGSDANPRLSAGIMTITENGKFMGSVRTNANGFSDRRRGIPPGSYVVLPKAKEGD